MAEEGRRSLRSSIGRLVPSQFERWFHDVHVHLDDLAAELRAGLAVIDRVGSLTEALQHTQRRLTADADIAVEALLGAQRAARRLERAAMLGSGAESSARRAERDVILPFLCRWSADMPTSDVVLVGATGAEVATALALLGMGVMTIDAASPSAHPSVRDVRAPLDNTPGWPRPHPLIVGVLWELQHLVRLSTDLDEAREGSGSKAIDWLLEALPRGSHLVLALPTGTWDSDVPGRLHAESDVIEKLQRFEVRSASVFSDGPAGWMPAESSEDAGSRRLLLVHAAAA